MLKSLLNSFLGKFDLMVVGKNDQVRLKQALRYRKKIMSQIPWSRYWAALPQKEREFIAPYIAHSRAQLGQDLFALIETRGGSNRKFFVEFGAADGVLLSNTWLLEKKLGWDGIVAEPAQIFHETLRNNRSCAIDTRCVSTRTGDKVAFLEVSDSARSIPELLNFGPELSTIGSYADNGDWASKFRLRNSREYLVETVSLNDLLQSHGAPHVIDYMSIDTEGSELDILRSFDFEKYEVRVISVEHNFRPDVRTAIFELLSSKGFVRKHVDASRFDDWYAAAVAA
jgi:FkbM family methyltransferase